MSLNSILAKLSQPSWLTDPAKIRCQRGQARLSGKDLNTLLDDARNAVQAKNSVAVENNLYAGLVLDEERFLPKLRKDGLLRLSRHSYEQAPLANTVATLLRPNLGLSPTVVDYLRSVSHLYEVALSIRVQYDELKAWLAAERETGVKSALAALDFLFLRQSGAFWLGNKRTNSRHPTFFSIEELAEGFSAILALYGHEFGALRGNAPINADASKEGAYFAALLSAAHIAEFREWEFQVDRMGYRLLKDASKSEYSLCPPSPEFGRAVELGFIQSFSQRVLKSAEWINTDDHSFEEMGARICEALDKAGHITLDKEPVERYKFGFPEPVLNSTARIGELLREERVFLVGACRDLLTPIDDLLAFDIGNGLSLHDLFLVSRLMQVMRSTAAAKLLPEMKARPGVVFQSLIPVFKRENLIELVGTAVGKEKAEAAIEMMTIDILGHVDIQYQPLVPAGSTIWLPANVFSNSNVYRNPLVVNRRRLYEDGSIDPLSESLQKAFSAKGNQAKTGTHYRWNGEKGEVDVLVYIDDLLFAFECKNSLLPTGVHELMTSLDYINTAADQLERLKRVFADSAFRAWLAKETGFAISPTSRLVTGIIMSNRMFMGMRANGHPVRGSYELEHFVDEGTITMGDETHRYWLGSSFTGEDLRRFLEDDVTYKPQWDAMESYFATYHCENCVVKVERMYVDMLALADALGFKEAREGLIAQQAEFDRINQEQFGELFSMKHGEEGADNDP